MPPKKPAKPANNAQWNRFQELAVTSSTTSFEKILTDAHNVLERSRPSVASNEETVEALLGPKDPEIDDVLTAEAEQQVQEDWEASCWKRSTSEHRNKLSLWKLCTRLHRKTPFSIVSPVYSLVWDGSGVWSDDFCKALKTLCAQPVFHRDNGWRMIPIFLQFAVICRTADTRPWEFEWPGDSSLLQDLSREARKSTSATMAQRHDTLLLVSQRQNGLPSIESDILYSISSTCQTDGSVLGSDGEKPLYKLKTRDVSRLVQAPNNCTGPTGPVFGDAETKARTFDAANVSSLPDARQLKEWIRRSYITELRLKKRKDAPPPPAPEPPARRDWGWGPSPAARSRSDERQRLSPQEIIDGSESEFWNSPGHRSDNNMELYRDDFVPPQSPRAGDLTGPGSPMTQRSPPVAEPDLLATEPEPTQELRSKKTQESSSTIVLPRLPTSAPAKASPKVALNEDETPQASQLREAERSQPEVLVDIQVDPAALEARVACQPDASSHASAVQTEPAQSVAASKEAMIHPAARSLPKSDPLDEAVEDVITPVKEPSASRDMIPSESPLPLIDPGTGSMSHAARIGVGKLGHPCVKDERWMIVKELGSTSTGPFVQHLAGVRGPQMPDSRFGGA